MTTVEDRLRILEDRFAISELRSKYGWFTARGQRNEVVGLFTPDGIFENHRSEGSSPAIAEGEEGLVAYFARMAPGRRLPMVTNEVVHIDGDVAEGTCVMMSAGNEPFCGHYVDSFVRSHGGWLFRKRSFYPYWPVFAPDMERPLP